MWCMVNESYIIHFASAFDRCQCCIGIYKVSLGSILNLTIAHYILFCRKKSEIRHSDKVDSPSIK